jgi:hypothetical protein
MKGRCSDWADAGRLRYVSIARARRTGQARFRGYPAPTHPSAAILESMCEASCRRLPRTEHGRDLAPAIHATEADLAAGHEAKQKDQRRVLGRQAVWVFTRRWNSSCSRSITFVVLSVFHWLLGN